MQEPNLNRMWETFIRIGLPSAFSHERFYHMARFMVHHTASDLENKKIIDWFCFLIHNRDSGQIPTSHDDNNLYFHIRVSLREGVRSEEFLDSLPKYCVMTREVKRERVDHISIGKNVFIDTSLFRKEKIEEAWRILGEQSEWFLKMLDTFKENIKITPLQVGPFLHYYSNMFQLPAL